MGQIQALILYGGWGGHQPQQMATFAEQLLSKEFLVTTSSDLCILNDEARSKFGLIKPIWTLGEISADQEQSLF